MLMPNSAGGVHDKVFDLIEFKKDGTILDAPCGNGLFSRRLRERGFKVFAIDINTSIFGNDQEGIFFKRGDLTERLDYADKSFDYVVSIEGIEHIAEIRHLLTEFSRIIRPGGHLILSTPNINNFISRIKFFIFGSFSYFNSRISIGDKSLAGHINPVWFPELEVLLDRSGFTIERIDINNDIRLLSVIFFIPAVILKFINKIFNKAFNERLCRNELLFGEIIIVKALRR